MQGVDQILGTSGLDLARLGARFGLTPEQTRSAMGSLMPAIAGGFQKRAEADDLGSVTNVAQSIDEPDADSGNAVLGQIFGSKDVSRQVAGHAADQSGVSSAVLKAMLPVVAAMVAKHFAANAGGGGMAGGGMAGGGLGGGLGGILGSLLGGGTAGGGGLGGLGDLLGGAGGGNPLDSILARR